MNDNKFETLSKNNNILDGKISMISNTMAPKLKGHVSKFHPCHTQ